MTPPSDRVEGLQQFIAIALVLLMLVGYYLKCVFL